MSLYTRLVKLEQIADRATPLMPSVIIYCKGELPSLDEQQQIDQAEANGQHTVVFTIKSAEI